VHYITFELISKGKMQMAENKKPEQKTAPDAQPEVQEKKEPRVRRLDRLDYAPKGGRYIVNGQLVDANGDPVKDSD
jgi:hypothetical protein